MAKVEGFADNATFQRGITRVPFSPTTVRHLMVLQTRHDIHPYTCGNRGNGKHEKIGGQTGILIPTINGWVCPDCDYTQDWVHNSFLSAIIFDVAFDKPSHAPASTATSEVIEKYAAMITRNSPDIIRAFDVSKTSSVAIAILTRFASEIGTVDAERVGESAWTALHDEYKREHLLPNSHEDESIVTSKDRVVRAVASAIKSTGGGKNE